MAERSAIDRGRRHGQDPRAYADDEPDDGRADRHGYGYRRPGGDEGGDRLRTVERVAQVAVQEAPQEAPVLVGHGPVETEPPGHVGHGLGRGLPAGQEAGHIVRRNEEHDEDDDADHQKYQAPCRSRLPRKISMSIRFSPRCRR